MTDDAVRADGGDDAVRADGGDDAVRAVFFDLDGTLVEFTGEYAEVVRDVTERHLGVGDEAFEVTYSERFLELLGEQGDDPYRRAFEHAIAEHDYDGSDANVDADANAGADADAGVDAAAMVDSLREREVEFMEPPASAHRVLAELRERGYRVGVVTNGVPAFQHAKIAGNDLNASVDATVVSYEAGAHKPDERAFALAAERLPADEYVMVGDSYEADVEGARAFGWRAIHYAPDGDSPDGDDAIASFEALLDVLD